MANVVSMVSPDCGIPLPDRPVLESHVIQALSRYWSDNDSPIRNLPIVYDDQLRVVSLPLRLVEIKVPFWASSCAVDEVLLVPMEALPTLNDDASDENLWRSVDWIVAIFLLMEGWHEREFEYHNGPIHSYSYRLSDWDTRVWERAWVNRIAIFLRLWCGNSASTDASSLLGPMPESVIHVTHDVDAVEKTWAIRLKQGGFFLFNFARALTSLDFKQSLVCLKKAARFLVLPGDWFNINELADREASLGISAVYHFYGAGSPKTFVQWLFDPNYNIDSMEFRGLFSKLHQAGHSVGIHPTFQSWGSSKIMRSEIQMLEAVSGSPVRHCRQHWLRFSWFLTWAAQEEAGVGVDTTLMFNDRPGFRSSTAIAWTPWDASRDSAMQVQAIPSVFMDSHFYDYRSMKDCERVESLRSWISECKLVGGEIAVLWHPHTLTPDYGWEQGFTELLQLIEEL